MKMVKSLLLATALCTVSGASVVAQNTSIKGDKLAVQTKASTDPIVEQINRLKAAGKRLGADAESSCDNEIHAECEVVIVFDAKRPGSALLVRLIADYVALLDQVTEYKSIVSEPDDPCFEKPGQVVCNVPTPRPKRSFSTDHLAKKKP